MQNDNKSKQKKKKKKIWKHGCWKLVRVKKVFTPPDLNDVFLVSHDLDL